MNTALIAFVPVIHKGYVDFFRSQKGDILIFGEDVIALYVHLTRDLRTISPDDAVKALREIVPGRKISVLHLKDLKQSKKLPYDKISMPDDEVCHDLAEKYLSGKKVEFISVFLRWNRVITFKEFEIAKDRVITREKFHKDILALATKEAQKSADWWRQIGAILIKKGKVIGGFHNTHLPSDFHLAVNGDPRSNFDAGQYHDIVTSIHAEAGAIAEAAKKGISLKGADLYVTTFPCPTCARLAGVAGIKRVFYSKGYSLLDAENILKHFGVELILVDDGASDKKAGNK